MIPELSCRGRSLVQIFNVGPETHSEHFLSVPTVSHRNRSKFKNVITISFVISTQSSLHRRSLSKIGDYDSENLSHPQPPGPTVILGFILMGGGGHSTPTL